MGAKNFEVYTAESKARDVKSVFKAMFTGLFRGRYLAYRLFIKDLKAEYSQSMLGIGWEFLEPIVLALIFILLRRGNVINSGNIRIPYHVFVIYGLLLWQTFTESLTMPLNIMQRSKTLLTQVKVPPETLLLSVFFKVSFHSCFRIIVMFALAFFMNTLLWLGFMKFLLLYPTIILTGMTFGVLFAPFNVIYNDVEKIIKISQRPLMYSTPVLFAVPRIKLLMTFNAVNPIGIILSNLRSLATQNLFQNMSAFIITCLLLTATFLTAWFIFHLSIPILSDRL